MTAWIAARLARTLRLPEDSAHRIVHQVFVAMAAGLFVLLATLIVAFDYIFPSFNESAQLQVGGVAGQAITAPAATFESQILTDDARVKARAAVASIYNPPDPNVARQQTDLAQQILIFIDNARRDPYGTKDQKTLDLNKITALTFSSTITDAIIKINDDTWSAMREEIINVLPRVMRDSIQPDDINASRSQLHTQISIRFTNTEREVIVAIIEDLLRPNTFEDVEATAVARDAAEKAVLPVMRRFVRGENVVDAGRQITAIDYEALQALGLLLSENARTQETFRAFIASTIVMVLLGLYMTRFEPALVYQETRLLMLLAVIFLMVLALLRMLGVQGNLYLFPTASLALVYVAVVGPHLAIIASLGLAFLTGIMANNSLEVATLIAAGSMIAAFSLRRAERLNAFFFAGLLVGILDAAVVGVFTLATPLSANDLDAASRLIITLFSGALITPATAIALMYVITVVFNLTTPLKLIDLSQPNKPLLQRLLREAPGTYQHSLQVANLAEQAANAIGADAQITHVAALYHDIGKMLNPLFFTENQHGIANPHDTLNDPYRSADIIIRHVTEGSELAKQYHLPRRIRDFILEHHGTTTVYVFYQKALAQAGGDKSAVDQQDFTYPGPRPRSRETAILLLADSCEAAVRAARLQSRTDIIDIVTSIFESKRKEGQLDQSGLTLGDLRTIQDTFVNILQGIFHPRLNYQEAISGRQSTPSDPVPRPAPMEPRLISSVTGHHERLPEVLTTGLHPEKRPTGPLEAPAPLPSPTLLEEEPMKEVPRLPRTDDKKHTGMHQAIRPSNGVIPPIPRPPAMTPESDEASEA